jgi:hypothetical protein
MAQNFKNTIKSVMSEAWRMVKVNGKSISEALRLAWANYKLRQKMLVGVVEFHFVKANGEVRRAFGTLKQNLIGEVKGVGRTYAHLQTYWDTEKMAWRSFNKAELMLQ